MVRAGISYVYFSAHRGSLDGFRLLQYSSGVVWQKKKKKKKKLHALLMHDYSIFNLSVPIWSVTRYHVKGKNDGHQPPILAKSGDIVTQTGKGPMASSDLSIPGMSTRPRFTQLKVNWWENSTEPIHMSSTWWPLQTIRGWGPHAWW